MDWTDNKRIALLYLTVVTALFLLGGVLGTVLRVELASSQENLLTADLYGRLFSMHGIIMVFFVLIPAIPAILGTLLLPRLLGGRVLALPRLALMSWILFAAGAVLIFMALLSGGVDTGWTFYTRYSTGDTGGNLLLTACGVALASGAMILLGINFITTIHTMLAKGLSWFKLPLLVWSFYATSWTVVFAFPVLLLCMVLLALEQAVGIGVFNPAIGGDPALFQKLFWFFARPALGIMILPAIGIVCELLQVHSRYGCFGYRGIVLSIIAVAVLSFFTTGGHIFSAPGSVAASVFASVFGLLTTIPFLVILFSWILTLTRGSISYSAAMVYVLGCIALIIMGGLGGLFLAATGAGAHLHSSYFVVAHLHYLMAGAVLMAYLGGLHFWWPDLSGRLLPDVLGKLSAILVFLGIHLTFLPQFLLGFSWDAPSILFLSG